MQAFERCSPGVPINCFYMSMDDGKNEECQKKVLFPTPSQHSSDFEASLTER